MPANSHKKYLYKSFMKEIVCLKQILLVYDGAQQRHIIMERAKKRQ